MYVFILFVFFIAFVSGDCNSPTTLPNTQRIVEKEYLGDRSLTVYNLCGDDLEVYYGPASSPLPDDCKNGSYCTDLSHTNPALWVAKRGYPSLNFGARTLVELNFLDPASIWWDISLVKGFNVGAKIVTKKKDGSPASVHPETICTSVNCEDAYWICDTAWNNLFHPVYNTFGSEGVIEVTFCPQNVSDSIPLHRHKQLRQVQGNPPFYCACSEGIPKAEDIIPPIGTSLDGELCGPISS
jgi:hypothetical protein